MLQTADEDEGEESVAKETGVTATGEEATTESGGSESSSESSGSESGEEEERYFLTLSSVASALSCNGSRQWNGWISKLF